MGVGGEDLKSVGAGALTGPHQSDWDRLDVSPMATGDLSPP